ncbi:MAG: hypothetical protein WCE75_07775 [Terracidiphilus sp.]
MSTLRVLHNPEVLSTSALTAEAQPRPVRAVVLVGFCAPMLAFARRASSAGIRVHLIELVTGSGRFVRLSNALEPDGIAMDWALVGTPQGLRVVRDFVQRVGAGAILSKDDYVLTWLGKCRAALEPACRVLAPPPEVLEPLLDKCYQIDRAVEAGFELLPGWLLSSAEVIRTIPGYVYPVVIRPSRPFSAHPTFKAEVIGSRRALTALFESTRFTQPPVVQQFCLGPNYVLHGVRSCAGRILAIRLFKAYRKYRGFATSIVEEPLPPRLERAAVRFVERENLTGAFHFDLLRAEADDSFYFLEVNCRLGGTTARVTQLGYDEPGLLLEAFHLVPPRPLSALEPGTQATSISLNLHQAIDELRNRRDPLAYPRLPRLRSLLAALREAMVVHDGLFNWQDLLFALRYPRWRARA